MRIRSRKCLHHGAPVRVPIKSAHRPSFVSTLILTISVSMTLNISVDTSYRGISEGYYV